MSMPCASARHAIDEMSPVQTITMERFCAGQKKMIKNLAKMRRPAAVVSRDNKKVKLLGGDNMAESMVSQMKRTLRRTNLLGRSAPATAHVDALYARFISSKPGLKNVLNALALTRKCRANQVRSDPKDYLDITKDKDWLWI